MKKHYRPVRKRPVDRCGNNCGHHRNCHEAFGLIGRLGADAVWSPREGKEHRPHGSWVHRSLTPSEQPRSAHPQALRLQPQK